MPRPLLPPEREVHLPHRKRAVVALLLMMVSGSLWAGELEAELTRVATARLDEYLAARQWPAGSRQLHVWLPDGAAHLPPCQQPVATVPLSSGGQPWGRQLYRLSCSQPAWELQGRVDLALTLPVLFTKRDLPRGHTLGLEDLDAKETDVTRLYRDIAVRPEEVLGRQTLRRIRVGQLLSAGQLQAALWVRKGDIVVMRAGETGFAATMKGEALEAGGPGDSVKVRNLSSGKVIQTWVVERGIVETRY